MARAKTVILLTEDQCFAFSNYPRIISRWKRCAEKSCINSTVLQDTKNAHGQESYCIEVPYALGRKSVNLLIPNQAKEYSAEELDFIMGNIEEALTIPEGGVIDVGTSK